MSMSRATTMISVFVILLGIATCNAGRRRRMKNRPAGLMQRSNNQYRNGLFTRKQLTKTFSQGCGLVLKMKCQLIVHRCHTGILSKRSIDDEQENESMPTTRLPRRQRRRRRPNRGKKIIRKVKIGCVLCRSRCWN